MLELLLSAGVGNIHQEALLTRVSERLTLRLEQLCPHLSGRMRPWLDRISGGAGLPKYFTHPYAFPTLLLPWWLEEVLRGEIDLEFQEELTYSSVCGYLLIRLFDNVMDDGDKTAMELLPAASILHSEFHSAYFRYFPYGHPFWAFFDQEWARCSEAAAADAALADVTEADFQLVTARKLCAASIPLYAVSQRCGVSDLPSPWKAVLERLYTWHQFHNDFFDWQRDHNGAARTYFLCEADRRRGEGSVLRWVLHEGFAWGSNYLSEGIRELRQVARDTGSSPLQCYLEGRELLLKQVLSEAAPGMTVLGRLLGPPSP